jgi:hypothetical protein
MARASRMLFYTHEHEWVITPTSTPWAPWCVVRADHKYAERALVGGVLVNVIEQIDLHLPGPDGDELEAFDRARRSLIAEEDPGWTRRSCSRREGEVNGTILSRSEALQCSGPGGVMRDPRLGSVA